MTVEASLKAVPAKAKDTTPKPPGHLSPAAKKWFTEIHRTWRLEVHHTLLVQAAAEAWDRAQEAEAILSKDGIVILDRYKKPKAHPAVTIKKDAEASFSRLVRELDLDSEPAPDYRAPRLGRNR